MKRFIKINVTLAGYTQGQQWPYEKAPDVIKMWLEKKAVLVEERICSLVGEDGRPLFSDMKSIKEEIVDIVTAATKKTLTQINQEKIDKLLEPKQEKPKLIKPDRKTRYKKRGRPKGSGKK